MTQRFVVTQRDSDNPHKAERRCLRELGGRYGHVIRCDFNEGHDGTCAVALPEEPQPGEEQRLVLRRPGGRSAGLYPKEQR